jgi:hypothetical protein
MSHNKLRKEPTGAQMVHEAHKAAEHSRKRPERDTGKERQRILRLGRTAAKKLVEGTMKRNKENQ